MYEPKFYKRLWKLGPRSLILGYDTFAGIIAFSATYILTSGGIPASEASQILMSFATVAGALFAIILTGFTVITSFTDRLYLYAWKQVGEFENIVTTFQYNLILPVIVLLLTLILQLWYHELGMLVLVAVFVYMLFSLIDLLGLISRYTLQRGEFIEQQIDQSKQDQMDTGPFTHDELRRILDQLNDSDQDTN